MAYAIDRGDAEPEGDGAQSRTLPVKTVTGRCGVRQIAPPKRQRPDAEGDIDGEQIRPRSNCQNASRDRRSDRSGYGDHHGIQPDAPPERVAWVDVSDEGHVNTHDPRRAKSLNNGRH